MTIGLRQVWAKTKPFQSIYTHSVLSGVVAQVLVEKMAAPGVQRKLSTALSCTAEEMEKLVGYLVSLHDIGKIEPQFQYRWPPMKEKMNMEGVGPDFCDPIPVRHERTTWRCLRERIWKGVEDRSTAKFCADVLGVHHQGKCGTEGERQNVFWNRLQEELEYQMRIYFLHTETLIFPAIEKKDRGSVGALLLGIVILADWIASSDYFAQGEILLGESELREQIRFLTERFLKLSGLAGQIAEFGTKFHEVWPNIPEERIRGLQSEVEALFQQAHARVSVVLLEAPMGEGKTEAGIYAAIQMARQWGKCGFYVGLPTAATSNQMVGRMRGMLSMHRRSEPVRLLHSMAWLTGGEDDQPWPHFETEEERYASGWLLPTRRGLLGSYAVGTVDQAMMSVLLVKYGVLRLLGLAGKALVIDELHSYDVYMTEILHRLLEWCKALEIPVVLLSATLPPEKKAQILSAYTQKPIQQCYPAVTAVTESGGVLVRTVSRTEKRQTVSVTLCPILHQAEEIAQRARMLTENGGCLCILLNTVRQAQEVYQAIRAQKYDGELLLFHARFPAEQRERMERRCIRLFGKETSNRPNKAILIATQVAEQSLDVDFDMMMTAVAPIDLLLQRLGREFRHEDTPRPPHITAPHLCVLIPDKPGDFGPDGFVYPECLLRQSIHLLERYSTIRIPEDLPILVTQGYDPAMAPPEELEHWMEHLMEDQVKAAAGESCLINEPDKGYSPIKEPEKTQFDDLESSSYLSAKTRLGAPAIRIALLPPERFQYFRGKSRNSEGNVFLAEVSRGEAREILKASVSVREKLLRHGTGKYILGRGMLEGTVICPGTVDTEGNMRYTQTDGSRIIVHKELGVLFEDGGMGERIV